MRHPQTKVPYGVFEASAEVRSAYFDTEFVLRHERLNGVFQKTVSALKERTGKHMVVVAGPTGVGKTTLAKRITDHVYQDLVPNWHEDPACIPCICVELRMDSQSSFDWKELYRQILVSLKEPLVDRKRNIRPAQDARSSKVMTSGHITANRMRTDMEEAIKDRKTRVIILDELQHMFKHGSGKVEQFYDVLKSISSRTDCAIVGIGTYELCFMMDWSAQMSRVASYLQFPRYEINSNKGMQSFFNAYNGLLAHVPMELDENLLEPDIDLVYVGCCGCVGILKDWIYRAMSRAENENAAVLTFEHLASTIYPTKVIKRIIQEIKEGEDTFRQPAMADIYEELIGAGSLPVSIKKNRSRKASASPGVRMPKRDPVHAS
ncbi:ATP-binding protein [Marinobacter sp.]|uniref:ATP-binding protein n=1 Tax=Marinobacter sp. TaxID=50741 RepID=UPI0023554D7A|nr:ATP-binding protein [Marinobacter sp.]